MKKKMKIQQSSEKSMQEIEDIEMTKMKSESFKHIIYISKYRLHTVDNIVTIHFTIDFLERNAYIGHIRDFIKGIQGECTFGARDNNFIRPKETTFLVTVILSSFNNILDGHLCGKGTTK